MALRGVATGVGPTTGKAGPMQRYFKRGRICGHGESRPRSLQLSKQLSHTDNLEYLVLKHEF